MEKIKRAAAWVLTVCLVLALAVTPALADGDSPLPEDHNIPNTVRWSVPSIDGDTVTNETYLGKIQVLILFRANGECVNSNQTIGSIAKSDWVKSDKVQVIAVGMGEEGQSSETIRQRVTDYKAEYAPDCDEMKFCYISVNDIWNTFVLPFQDLLGEGRQWSIVFAVNYIIDAENNFRFTWQGGYESAYYGTILSILGVENEEAANFLKLKVIGTEDYDSAYRILELLNDYRRENGKSELTMDSQLLETAMQRGAEIAVYYSHTRPDHRTCFTAFPPSHQYKAIRENIAAGYSSADDVMDGWIHSPGHNANMLADENRSVGIGAFESSDGTLFWVQVFSSGDGTAESVPTDGKVDVIRNVQASDDLLHWWVSREALELQPGKSQSVWVMNANIAFEWAVTQIGFTYAAVTDENVASVKLGEDGKAEVSPVGVGETVLKVGFSTLSGAPLTTDIPVTVTGTPLMEDMFTVDTTPETYTGEARTKAIISDLVEEKDYSVSYSDNINVGTATITITGKGIYTGTLTYTFTINKAGREISASAEREQLYVTGSPSGIAVTDNAANDGPVYTYSSSDTTVADVKDGEITPVGIGTATITVNAEATDNYLAGSAAFSVTVSALPEQELSFSESGDLVRTYGDASFSHAAVNRSADGGAVTYSSSDEGVARIDDAGMVTVTGVGTTVLTATAAPVEGRYAQTSVSCTLTVGPRQIAVTGAVIADKVYDGSTVAEVKSVTFDGVVDGDELLPGVDYTATAVFTDATAGEHKEVSVTVTLTNKNYALEDTTYTASATIVKARLPELLAEVTVRAEENRTARIDLTTLANWPKDLTAAKVTADAPEESGVTVTAEGLEITLTSRGTKSAGDTEVVALTLSDMTNYEDAPLTVTVTYTGKSDVTLSGISVADKVYDGRPAAFTGELLVTDSETGAVIPVTDADTACIWTDADSGEVLEQSPVNAGSYKLTVTVETDDCTGSLELPFTIAKAPLTVRPQDVTVYVGSALPERFSIGFFGLVNNESADDVLTVEGTPEFVLMNGDKELADSGTAGTYTILWRNKDSVVITAANYEVVKTDGTLTVLAYSAPPSVPAPAVYTVTVNEADNVKIAVSAKTAGAGDKITVTVTPDTGYGVREVSVTGSSGRAAAVTRTGEGTYEFPMPAEDVTVSAKAEKLPVPFDDVGDTWYTDSVWYVYYHDLMFGASSSGFSPNSTVSRAQVVTVLWRMAGMPRVDYTSVFTDVGRNDWYTQAVLWAADKQIVFGFSDGLFGPNDPVSREQLAAMLYRYAGAVGLDRAVSTRPAGLEDVSPWAVEAMAWCVDRGLILGSDIGLDPQGRTTRAQLAAMIRRFDPMQH